MVSLSRAAERRAARSQAKPKQRIALGANNELFCTCLHCLTPFLNHSAAVEVSALEVHLRLEGNVGCVFSFKSKFMRQKLSRMQWNISEVEEDA